MQPALTDYQKEVRDESIGKFMKGVSDKRQDISKEIADYKQNKAWLGDPGKAPDLQELLDANIEQVFNDIGLYQQIKVIAKNKQRIEKTKKLADEMTQEMLRRAEG